MDLVLKKKARDRQLSQLKNVGASFSPNEENDDPVHVDERLAKMVEVKRHYQEQVKAQARERMLAGVKPYGNFPQGPTRDVIGGIVGVSGRTLEVSMLNTPNQNK